MTESGEPPRRGPLQGGRGIALIAAGSVIFVGLVSFAILAVLTAGEKSGFSGCTIADRKPIPALQRLEILRKAPDGARLQDLNSGCDSSDHRAHAEASYLYGGERETAAEFYRTVAAAEGWTLKKQNRDPSVRPGELAGDVGSLCFTKAIDNFTASLELIFKGDIPINAPTKNDFWLIARANSASC